MHYAVFVVVWLLAVILLQPLAYLPLHVVDALRLPNWLLWGAIALVVGWLMKD